MRRNNRIHVDTLLWRPTPDPRYPRAYRGGHIALRVYGNRALRFAWTQSGSAWSHGLDGAFNGPTWRNWTLGPIKFVWFRRVAAHFTIGRLTISALSGATPFWR